MTKDANKTNNDQINVDEGIDQDIPEVVVNDQDSIIEDLPEKNQKKSKKAKKQKTKSDETVIDHLELQQQIIDLTKERDALLDQAEESKNEALRHMAELENVKRRKELEKQDAIKFANSNLILDILPVLDSFDLASQQIKPDSDESTHSFVEGLTMIKKQIEQFLTKLGVERIESVDQPFDPNLHQGISKEVNAEKEENTILKEMQPGYKLNDRVLRPSMVVVSTKS